MSWSQWIAIGVGLGEWAVRLSLVVIVIMRRRPVPATLAWLVLLLLVPVLGIVAYVLVGENRLGSRRIKRHRRIASELEAQAVGLWRHRHQDWSDQSEYFAPLRHLATVYSAFPAMTGNSLTLLSRSELFLQELVRDIDAAQSHCHVLFYIYTTTPGCVEVTHALMRAARRGVSCRLLVDGIGSRPFLNGPMPAELRRAGVQVVSALPVNPLRALFSRLDLRNHRKIVVIDGRIAYTGSQNLTDSSFRAGSRDVGPWIDAMVRIDGPAAQALGVVFLEDWLLDSREPINNLDTLLPALPAALPGSSVVQIVPSGPGETPEAIHQALLTAIYTAREELLITTPYFVPDEATRKALQAAALRGVRVSLIMPKLVDSPLVAAASRSHWLDLLEAGVRIHLFRNGLLHAKIMCVDRRLGLIGSANLDQRSFWLNFEITLIAYDDEFASELRFLQMSYLSKSEEVDLHHWRNRQRSAIFVENSAQLLGPLL